jgi:hypothetical protein
MERFEHFKEKYRHHDGMHYIKFPVASQAKSIRQYKNIKRKIFICNANIYFNQQWPPNL